MENSRYRWKRMPEDYEASYFNDRDFLAGKKFIVIDTKTGREYAFPTEVRKTDTFTLYGKIILANNFMNEEFMAWAICTSEDWIEHLSEDWITPSLLKFVIDHFEFPAIFNTYKISCNMTGDLWDKAFHRNEEVVRYVPKVYITSEMINSLGDIKNPPINHVPYEDLTPELFEKMYFNSDSEHKLRLIPPAPTHRTNPNFIQNPFENFFSQKIADDILSINIRTIWHIPRKFISKEIAIRAMEEDFLLLPYIPAEYQTSDYQKRAIDENINNLSLIDPSVVTEEIIFYALSKSGKALSCVPKEKRTLEVCKYAVSNQGVALRSVPKNVNNSQLCFKAVVKDPSAIKYVPVEYLTQEFVNALNAVGIVIPMNNCNYVNECLAAHEKLEKQQAIIDEVGSESPKMDVNTGYSNIRLDSLIGLLTTGSLKLLRAHNISTVGELLSISDSSVFYNVILNNPKPVYKEIRGAIKLLKCKYMNVDPMIGFFDTGEKYSDMTDFSKEIGFSTRTYNVLMRSEISPKILYEIMKSPQEQKKLYLVRNAGKSTIEEILFKTQIVIDYYDKKAEKSNSATDDETIETLNEEIVQIRDEIKRLQERIDEILAKIQEKIIEKGKGGVLK